MKKIGISRICRVQITSIHAGICDSGRVLGTSNSGDVEKAR